MQCAYFQMGTLDNLQLHRNDSVGLINSAWFPGRPTQQKKHWRATIPRTGPGQPSRVNKMDSYIYTQGHRPEKRYHGETSMCACCGADQFSLVQAPDLDLWTLEQGKLFEIVARAAILISWELLVVELALGRWIPDGFATEPGVWRPGLDEEGMDGMVWKLPTHLAVRPSLSLLAVRCLYAEFSRGSQTDFAS